MCFTNIIRRISGKPKMFFIQACQGDQLDTGVHLKRVSNTETDSNSMSYKVWPWVLVSYIEFLIKYLKHTLSK